MADNTGVNRGDFFMKTHTGGGSLSFHPSDRNQSRYRVRNNVEETKLVVISPLASLHLQEEEEEEEETMDRYDDLDLECDGGGVAEKAALFGGMFKRPSRSAAPLVQDQDNLSTKSELSNSSESLNSNKEKGGGLKGMFKKTTKSAKEAQPQVTLSSQNPDLSASSDSLKENNKSSKDKPGVLGGILKLTHKPGHVRRPSQDLLESELSVSEGSQSENTKESGGMLSGMFKKKKTQSQEDLAAASDNDNVSVTGNTKESGGMFGGIFKKAPKSRTQSQEDLTAPSELSGSNDNLSATGNTKESGGVFSGMFKKSPKPFGARTQSQEDLTAPSEISGSNDNLSATGNTKESGGVFGGIFKKSPKPLGARTQSQEDLTAPSEISGSNDNLSVTGNTKESGGMFGGMFKKSPKPLRARRQSQDDLDELSGSNDNLSENSTKEKGGILSGVFKKKGAKSQSQDNLSLEGELSASSDSLSEKSSKGGAKNLMNLKNPFTSSSQEKEKTEPSGDSSENISSTEKPKGKQNGLTAMMKSTFSTDKREKNSDTDDEETSENEESQPGHKQNKFTEAMTKLNPFRSAAKKDAEDTENEKLEEEKSKPVKSNVIQRETKEMKRISTHDKVNPGGAEDNQDKKEMISRQKKDKAAETPVVPVRPSGEEMKRAVKPKLSSNRQSHSDDEGLKPDKSAEAKDGDKVNPPESKTTKVKKHKHHNPFMSRAATKAASDDEGLKEEDESSSKEENKDEELDEKKEATKVKKPKRHNPFMPRVKATVIQRPGQEDSEENDGGNRSLFDRLEDFRVDPSHPENHQDVEDLMEWWNTVEQWEDTPEVEDMTEKEEAKAFALTAEKVQKGIRVFNKLFSERAESLWMHVIDLNSIADGLDKFNKKTKIAQITGGSTSAIGGVATIAGLVLAPITLGTSLIVTAVGLGVATAGGLTSAGAGISNQVNNSMDRKKVEKIVEDYQVKMVDLNKCLKFIKQGIENLRRFDLLKMKKHAYNRDFPVLSSSFYEDGAMAGKAILINANEIMRVVQIANVAGSTAARAVQIASMATGVLTGLFVGMDIYFVAKDSKELKKGAKSEFAAKIREVATQLHDGLVELNSIREELQSTTPEAVAEDETADLENNEKKEYKYSSDEDEDEIDRIKKAIKKDIENREYV
ncbi:WASH complex subunit 2 isoform X2 [Hippoglossus stenolepis]|uniref:WASH complex subunit 2 isoform X2 n=1 Tax=Hippoglossus stenolepis TaxID=195615 RepID=UPI001FAF07AF|nr:WASH complex subunit 2 isoform X2 [Hippoglossus stenolepis]